MSELPEKPINDIGPSSFLKTVDRVTFIFKIHHQRKGKDAETIDSHGWYYCKNQEQKYSRTFILEKEKGKVPLDIGWMKDIPGTLVIENITGRNPTINLSKEQKEEIEKTNLRILIGDYLDPPEFIVRPNKIPFVAETASKTPITLCAEHGDVEITISVIPR